MYAVNALADRIIRRAIEEDRDEISVCEDDEPAGEFRAYHDTVFRSCSSDINGLLSLELARYLMTMRPRVKGRVCFSVGIRNFWDERKCTTRVQCYECFDTQEEADERQREIIYGFAIPWTPQRRRIPQAELVLVS